MQNKLSIVIPTKNRSNWLIRILKYYSKNNFSGQLLIGDSSNKEEYNKNKNNIKKFQNLKVKQFHLIDYTAESALEFLSKQIDSEYSIFLSDDDLLKIQYLTKFINFLNKNDDYIGVVGKTYMLKLNTNEPWGKIDKLRVYNLFFNSSNNINNRIKNYFDNIKACNMAIVRTDVFKYSLNSISQFDVYHQRYIFGEYYWAINYLIKGKIKFINLPYLLRQNHDTNIYSKINKFDFFYKANINKSLHILEKILIPNLNQKEYLFIMKEKIIHNIIFTFYNLKNPKSLFKLIKIFIYNFYHKIFLLKSLKKEIGDELNFFENQNDKI